MQEVLGDYMQRANKEFTAMDMEEVQELSLDEEMWTNFEMTIASAHD